jgi:hypothetical protein
MIKQRILDHGNGDAIGDCFNTCVANIIGMPYEDVPHFVEIGKEHWWEFTINWAEANGYRIGAYKPEGLELIPGALVIGTGKSPRGNFNHSVILDSNLELYFDPHPDDTGIETLLDVIVIEPKD